MQEDYFELFQITPGFDIDVAKLRSIQQELQTQFHPDKHVNADADVQRQSVAQAATINEAYQVLSNPVRRARYLLQREGIEFNDESETTADTAFLMEQIEYREAMDNCRDSEDPLHSCDLLIQTLQSRLDGLGEEFVSKFDREEIEEARLTSRKMQFVENVLQQVIELQYELEDELS